MMIENDIKMTSHLLTKLQNNSTNNNGQQSPQCPSTSVLLLPGRHDEYIINIEKHYHSMIEQLTSLTEEEMTDLISNNANVSNASTLNEIFDCIFCAFLFETQNSSKYLNCLDSSTTICWNHMLYNVNFVLIEEFSFLKPKYRHRLVQFLAETIQLNVPSVDSCLSNLFRALSDGTEFPETCNLVLSVAQMLNRNHNWIGRLKKNSLVLADAFAFMARFIADAPLVAAHSSIVLDSFKSTLILTCEVFVRERFAELATIMGRDLTISLMRLSKLSQFQSVWKALLHNPSSLTANYSLKQLMLCVPTDKFLGSRVSVSLSRKIENLFSVIKRLVSGQNKTTDLHLQTDKLLETFKNMHLSGPDGGTMRAEIIRHILAYLKPEQLTSEGCEARAALIGCLLRSAKMGAELQWCKLMLFWDWFGFETRLGCLFIEPAFTTVRSMLNKFPRVGNSLVDFLIRETQILCPQLNSFFVQSITNAFKTLEKTNFPIHAVLDHPNLDQQLKEQLRSTFVDLFPKKVTAIANNLAEPSTIIDFDAIRNTSASSLGTPKAKIVDGTTAHNHPNGRDLPTEGQGNAKRPKLGHNQATAKERLLSMKQQNSNSHTAKMNLKKHLNEMKTEAKEHPQQIRKRKRTKSKEETSGIVVKEEQSAELRSHYGVVHSHSPAVPSTSEAISSDIVNTLQNEGNWEGQQADGGKRIEDSINKLENLLPMVREEFREHLEELEGAIRQRRYSRAEQEVRALADSLFEADEFDTEQAECISLCLLHIFLKGQWACSSKADPFTERETSDRPIFIFFHVIAQFEENESRKSLLKILATMRKECACVGYLFLAFIHMLENERDLGQWKSHLDSKRVADTYKSFCEVTKSNLEGVLVEDLEKCSFDDVNLFAQILPCALSSFYPFGSPHKLLRVICTSIDPRQLSQLMSEIVRENIVLFSPDEILSLLHDSLKWESMEQFMLWQLVQVEAVELDKFLDLLQRLNYAQHPEATAAILVIIRNMEPDPDPAVMKSLLKNLFLRQPDWDLFTVDALKLLVDYSDNIPPMSDCISKMINRAIHCNDICAPAGKARPKMLMVENILDHLVCGENIETENIDPTNYDSLSDRFRRHCIGRESKGVESWLKNELTLELFRTLKHHSKLGEIRSRFAELFALFDILLDTKRLPKEGGRHRRGRGGKGGSSLSSKGALDLDQFDEPSFKKRREIIQQSDNSEESD